MSSTKKVKKKQVGKAPKKKRGVANKPRVLIAGDIHVARMYDQIAKIIPRKYKTINPNKEFKKLLKQTTPNDHLILNGDLIDYYWSDYTPTDASKNNWEYFFTLTKKANCPLHYVLGNHDLRVHAMNLSFSGLEHINLSKSVRKAFQKKIGFHHMRSYEQEYHSLKVDPELFDALATYPHKHNLSTTIGKYRVITLNTGPDAANNFRWLFRRRLLKLLLRDPPASQGLDKRQIKFLRRELKRSEEQNVLVVMHTPPFAPESFAVQTQLRREDYFRQLRRDGFTFTTFIKKNYQFITTLTRSKKNIVVVSSHTHVPHAMLLKKRRKLLMQTDLDRINLELHKSAYIKFVGTPALSHVDSKAKFTGYLSIEEDQIKLVETNNYTNNYLIEYE